MRNPTPHPRLAPVVPAWAARSILADYRAQLAQPRSNPKKEAPRA